MLRLYHTGFQVIPSPDVRYGRKNADFGQGFYLTADKTFAQKWAREQKGRRTYINCYELDPDGLSVLRLARGAEWFDYLSRNCAGKPDSLKDYDVITGPVAPDILYDTQGILTSGLLCRAPPAFARPRIRSDRPQDGEGRSAPALPGRR